MERRSFIAALMGTAVLDPERLLWKPGQKLISIPRPRVASDIEVLTFIANDILRQFGDNLSFIRHVSRSFPAIDVPHAATTSDRLVLR